MKEIDDHAPIGPAVAVQRQTDCRMTVAGTIPCATVAEGATTFAFMDIDPGSDGHLRVIPKRHSAGLVEFPRRPDHRHTGCPADRQSRALRTRRRR
ncbi:HIT family protein [Blastococcus goldschmidtiae]|uniref:HIT domain-containing protein n=1 Tax=Blastococcus goldschmidtiae TaxID=3075546 RepID=A0ABU2K513_9ACTN|nr:HIT domain-containing protein [Blastococcus sp. DSM 46792]MDT0275253.1 HIT domain-containing protein [Blastococcus sp. DSM 46792]